MISIIVAIDEKRGIGKNNALMWDIPEDLARFRSITKGHPIIMGRKTFESIGRVLPNRTNIIITRDPNYKFEGVVIVRSLDEAIKKANKIEGSKDTVISTPQSGREIPLGSLAPARDDNKEIFIIGGGQIFKEALEKDLVDYLYLTIVKGDFGADVFFPDYSEFTKIINHEDKESGNYKYSFLTLEKSIV